MSMADALQSPTSTSLCAVASDSLQAPPIVESSTTSTQSSNCTPLSSTCSSDPELNDVPLALLNDNMCSRAVSDGMTPSSFDLLFFPFPLTPLPHSTDLSSQEVIVSQPASIEQAVDTLQPPTSSAQSLLSSLDCLHPLPMANSNLPPSPIPNTTALPSSAYPDPEVCTVNNEKSSREKMTSEMEYLFDLFPLIPLPQSTELSSQEMSQSLSAEQGVDMSTSTVYDTVSGSLPTLTIPDSGTTSSEPSNCAPVSSTHSSEPERNNALNALLGGKTCSQEDATASGDMTPSIADLSLFFFPLTPLPHSTDLSSQGVSQPASIEQAVDTLQPPTSSAQCSLNCLHPLPMTNPNLPPSPIPNTTALPSSAYSDPEVCTVNNENSSREKMTSEMEYLFDLFPLIPLPQSTELSSQEMSQSLSAEQGVDMSTSTVYDTVSGSLPTLTIPDSGTTSSQPSNCAPVSSTHSSEPVRNNALNAVPGDKMCSQEDATASGDMTPSIADLSLFFFPLMPLPHSTDLSSQGVSQPASIEQAVDTLQPPTSSAQSSVNCLHPLPMANSNLPPSPIPNTTALPSSAYPDPEACTVNSENSSREKMTTEVGYIFDLFPLIPLPQSANLSSQVVSQPTPMEQRADMLQPPTSSASPHLLPGDQATNMQREKSSPSPQCSHSFSPEDEDIIPVCTHTNPNPPGIPAECLCIQSASTEQSIATSFSPAPTSAYHLKGNIMTEESSTETSSQAETESSVEAQNCMNKKQKLEKIVSVATEKQQRQRKLNSVSALHYRRRRKERESDLEVRMKQLGAENKRLKEQVSALTTEIDKMTKLLRKTQKTKVCPFFLNSTCSKLN